MTIRVPHTFLKSFHKSLRCTCFDETDDHAAQAVKLAGGTIARVLSNPGHEYGIYFDGDGPAKIILDLPAGHYSGAWVNIKAGTVDRPEDLQSAGKEIVLQSPEFKNGIALRLKRAAR